MKLGIRVVGMAVGDIAASLLLISVVLIPLAQVGRGVLMALHGAPRTKAQCHYHTDLVHIVGCVVCRYFHNTVRHDCEIHHLSGKSTTEKHWEVVPLCSGHHRDGVGDPVLVGCGRHATGKHGGKGQF